ncbi:hypothetical protein HMI55_006331 [Coelomomyces lativittatus]|nr:hypothetical protein HMI55_006331 [Coelomomyces lativittatus]
MLKLEKLISQRSHITATLDASPFLFPQLEEDNNEQRKPVKLDSLQLKYSTQSSLNDATSIGMIGKMFVHGQKGSGMVRAYAKKSFSPLTNGELSMNVVTWRDLHLKMSHVLDEKSHTMMKVDVHFSEYDHPPTFTMHLYRQLLQSRPLLGFVRFYSGYYRLGSWGLQKDLIGKLNKVKEQPSSALELGKHLVSSMTLGLQYTHLQHSVSVLSLQRSIFENTVSVYHQHRLGSLHSIDLALGLDFLSGGLMASWKWLFQLTEHVKAGLGVQLAHSGTVLAMDWERLGQRISLPIIVFPEPHIGIGFATTLLAVTVTGALSLGVYRPLKRLQRNKAFHFLKEQYKDLLLKRQREAKEASQLMLKIVQKKYIEEGKDGLLVLSAYYGCGRNVIDVTVPVMAFVEKSVLRLEGGRSKAMFIGFYDPCLGEKKNLEVTYYFRGLIRKTVVSDTAPLSCPLRSHELVPPGAVTVSPTVQEIFTVLDIDLTASDHLEEQTFLP